MFGYAMFGFLPAGLNQIYSYILYVFATWNIEALF